MTVRVQVRGSNLQVLVATARLESGKDAAGLRKEQLRQASEVMSDETVDAAVFAAAGIVVFRRRDVT